jgi:Ferritin-like domain
MYELNLDMIDQDGAIRETHEEAMGSTRLDFLRKAGIGAAGLASGGAILSALAPSAMAATTGAPPASFGAGDIGILNYALTLEYLERGFYNAALANGIVKNPELKGILNTAVRDERAHVAFLVKALGKKAVAEPKFNFGDAVKSESKFAATSFVLENTGVHAYSGQAGNIKTPAYLLAALSIVTIEARHAGAIGSYLKHTPGEIAPSGSFDTPLTAAKVLAAVKGTGFIVS